MPGLGLMVGFCLATITVVSFIVLLGAFMMSGKYRDD